VTQLTGFSDPVYAEAYVHVNQYDIVLDVLVVNQTNDTLQNLTVELATLGQSGVSATVTLVTVTQSIHMYITIMDTKAFHSLQSVHMW